MPTNAFYAQSGGVTAVINASAFGVLNKAKESSHINKVFVGRNGILGALHEELIDTSLESSQNIQGLLHTPGGAFGSCRYKLKDINSHRVEYERLVEVFKAHDIGVFFYNGGGDSQDTAFKVSQISEQMGYPIQCIGIPKTIDNDLPFTDACPGFGSVAKYVAISIMEAGLDTVSMSASSTKVFVMEVMGRHAGWIAAASGIAARNAGEPPHVILFPEIPLDEQAFFQRVQACVENYSYCTVVVSEGVKDKAGNFLTDNAQTDAFGHKQLGGVAPLIAEKIKTELGFKYHWAVCDYLQRAARHIASQTDVDQARALGEAAVEFVEQGKSAVMPVIVRENDSPYQWSIGEAPLAEVANIEKNMPREFISTDGFGITDACRRYIAPLIQGEAYPPYTDGLPDYVRLQNQLVEKKLQSF